MMLIGNGAGKERANPTGSKVLLKGGGGAGAKRPRRFICECPEIPASHHNQKE